MTRVGVRANSGSSDVERPFDFVETIATDLLEEVLPSDGPNTAIMHVNELIIGAHVFAWRK